MSWLDALTRPGLIRGNGNATFYDSPEEAMAAAAPALDATGVGVTLQPPTNVTVAPAAPAAPPAYATAPGAVAPAANPDAPPTLTTQGGGPEFTPSPTGALSRFFKPSFQQASTDQYGNERPVGPALTKLGALASVLRSAVQGGMHGLEKSAETYAATGRNGGFGVGLAGAEEMPTQQALLRGQVGAQAAQTANVQSETQLHQSESQMHQAQIPYFLQRAKAYNSLAQQRGNLSTQQQLDLATQDAIDNGRNPDIDPNVLQLRSAFKAEMEAKGSGRGTPQPRPDTPHTVSANGRILQYNPDSGRYDIDVGKAEKPAPAVNFNGGGDPVMERRAQQIEQNSTAALTSHQRNIAASIAKLDPNDPSYASQMAAIERDDYQGKVALARSYAKQRTAIGLPTEPPTFDPWTNSYLTDDERGKLLTASTAPAKSSGGTPLPWMKKGSSSNKHVPGNPYAQ